MKPETKILANTPIERVMEITDFFSVPENRGKIQLPNPESAYIWQNLGRMYNVVDVLRGGPISDLPIEENPKIGAPGLHPDTHGMSLHQRISTDVTVIG